MILDLSNLSVSSPPEMVSKERIYDSLIYEAVGSDNVILLQRALEVSGRSPNFTWNNSWTEGEPETLLVLAAKKDAAEIIRYLLFHGVNEDKWLAAEIAVASSYCNVVRALFETTSGAAPTILGHRGEDGDLFRAAVERDDLEMIRLLISLGANPNEGLWEASRAGRLESVIVFLEAGGNANSNFYRTDEEGWLEPRTPIAAACCAATKQRAEIVRALMEAGGDPEEIAMDSGKANEDTELARNLQKYIGVSWRSLVDSTEGYRRTFLLKGHDSDYDSKCSDNSFVQRARRRRLQKGKG